MDNPVIRYATSGANASEAVYLQRVVRTTPDSDREIVLYISSPFPITSASLVMKPRLDPFLLLNSGQVQFQMKLDRKLMPYISTPVVQLLSHESQSVTSSTYQYSITIRSKM